MMKSPIAKNAESGFIGIEVVGPFRNELHNEQVYMIVMRTKKAGNLDSPFYMSADVMARIVETFKDRMSLLFQNVSFDWVSNLQDLPLVSPTNSNQYKKNRKAAPSKQLLSI